MAKDCINPNCGKEIPSSAVFCSFCGEQQIADEELTEADKLRKELGKTEEIVKILKKSLADADDKIGGSNKKIRELEKRLTAEQTEQKNLQNQVAAKHKEVEQLKLLARKKKGNGGLIFFLVVFVLSALILGGVCLFLIGEADSWRSEITNLKNELQELELGQKDIKKGEEKLKQKLNDIAVCYPIIIKSLKIGNIDSKSTIITNYGDSIYASTSMFLQPQIEYVGLKPSQTITLYLKLYGNGELRIGASSPSGYSTKYDLYVSEKGKSNLVGWGGASRGYYPSGSYRYEIWYNDMCLKAVNFYLY
ncbi:MAG: hypothetical protein LBT70_03300 [Holosporaceae bacterium]|jgi:hypothetical protein|nr:hypothetical protein [Holosporaceae bacterium]